MLCFRLRAPLACAVACPIVGFFFESHDALACGACFHSPPPPSQVVDTSLVTDHRMAFSISQTQTVLWDQIRYSGTPTDFAWVLPIRAGARVELSSDAWLAALDASTRTVITGPTAACQGSAPTQYEGSGVGCGSSSASATAPEAVERRREHAHRAGDLAERGRPLPGGDGALVPGRSARSVAGGQRVRSASRPSAHDRRVHLGGLRLHRAQARAGRGRAGDATRPRRHAGRRSDASAPDDRCRHRCARRPRALRRERRPLSPAKLSRRAIDFTKLAWDPYSDISNYSTLAQNALAANGGRGWLTESSGPADLGEFSGLAVNPGLGFAYGAACVPSLPTCSVPDAGGYDAGSPALAMCVSRGVVRRPRGGHQRNPGQSMGDAAPRRSPRRRAGHRPDPRSDGVADRRHEHAHHREVHRPELPPLRGDERRDAERERQLRARLELRGPDEGRSPARGTPTRWSCHSAVP